MTLVTPARVAHGDQLGLASEQTHDDCQWLNEKDREEDVLRDVTRAQRREPLPRPTEDERRLRGEDDGSADNRWRDHDGNGLSRLFRRFAL